MLPDDPTLDLPPAAAAPSRPTPRPAADLPPAIGPYRILTLLGEGGFGSVYLAEQAAPVKRRVALKLIKPGMDSRAVVARFEAERQALALMDHPGVAKVYDAGVTAPGEGSRPYFAMELVRGEPITRFCATERTGVDGRIRLMIQVCEAVQHAHMKGIIHRDLKPSNILVELVDRRPVAKVIDFGVAKALTTRLTDSTVFTEHGQMIGTPEYMAPEQARGSAVDVDTRADVYSLGAILYELLTGVTPIDPRDLRSGGFAELQRRIEEQTPTRPSDRVATVAAPPSPPSPGSITPTPPNTTDPATLSRSLRGELDWIVMKCLEKERSRRYDSATALARDLERYLADEPVEAGPPSASYRAAKFVRRHRGAVAAAAAVALALTLAVIGTTWGMTWAMREQARAKSHAALAEEARAESEAVTAFLTGMLESVEPEAAGEGGGRDVTVRKLLDEATRTIAARFREQPIVEARLRHTIGNAYRSLGLLAAADAHLPIVVEMRRSALGETHPSTLLALGNLASLRFEQGRYEEAEALSLRALDGLKKAPDGIDETALGLMNNLAQLYSRQGRHAEAEAIQRDTLDGMERVHGPDHPHTLGAMVNLSRLLEHRGDLPGAEDLLRRSAAAWHQHHGPDHPGTLLASSNLAMLLDATGRAAEAEPMQRRVVEARARILGEDHPDTIMSLSNLGFILQHLDRWDDAEAAYLRAWEKAAPTIGEQHPDTLTTALNLASLYEAQGWPERSRPHLVRLLETLRRAAAHPDAAAQRLNACAWLLLTVEPADLRDDATALRLAQRACDNERAAGPGGSPGPDLWEYLDTLALALFRTGSPAEAAAAQREAISRIPASGEAYRAEMLGRLAEYDAAPSHPGG